MNEEYLLEQKIGRPQPFSVPEGYFESLGKSVMSKIPATTATPKRTITRLLRPAAWAACIAGVVITVAIYLNGNISNDNQMAEAAADIFHSTVYTDHAVDEVTDFAMLDNDDFYSLLADE